MFNCFSQLAVCECNLAKRDFLFLLLLSFFFSITRWTHFFNSVQWSFLVYVITVHPSTMWQCRKSLSLETHSSGLILQRQSMSLYWINSCEPAHCMNLWVPMNQKRLRKDKTSVEMLLLRSRTKPEAQQVRPRDINSDKYKLLWMCACVCMSEEEKSGLCVGVGINVYPRGRMLVSEERLSFFLVHYFSVLLLK